MERRVCGINTQGGIQCLDEFEGVPIGIGTCTYQLSHDKRGENDHLLIARMGICV